MPRDLMVLVEMLVVVAGYLLMCWTLGNCFGGT